MRRNALHIFLAGAPLVVILALKGVEASPPSAGVLAAELTPPPCAPTPISPGVPTPPIPCEQTPTPRKPHAAVCVSLAADQGDAAAGSDIVTYRIAVRNTDQISAKRLTLTLPFDPAVQSVLDTSFSDPRAWVSKLNDDAVTMRL